ncbi:MAG: Asp-tRNA(Asn)/Glu-tRNA(Gln) amidotransferase subunit GatB [Planctomycetes bacterium]|nr:Asp-tRNA(Asn)/Glu-tRNA(Gln) amidotransferase subunit GatB [Planctomycetota bacterium]
MTGYTTVIGLEVHVQLGTDSKLFSPAPVDALGDPNTRVHHVDLGLPGVLPRPNRRAIELATRAALALGAEVQLRSEFARKHYFYPDLPKGYQISQFDKPLALGGAVPIGDGKTCRLHRLHVEEDAGKLTHTAIGTLVDLNRAGVPLVEIVSEPDMRDPAEAHAFLHHLREVMRFAGVGDCDMELGSMRCDANVSLMPTGSDTFGKKVELKNLNSLKMVQRALEYEVRRQTAILAAGGTIVSETRGWHDELGESRSQRSKEQAPDYRYLPDPDLPPLLLDAAFVEAQRALVGELPDQRRARFRSDYGLSEHDVSALAQDRAVGDWFEQVVAHGAEPKPACNWLIEDLLPALRERDAALADSPVSPSRLAEVIALVADKTLTQRTSRQVLQHLLAHDVSPRQAIRDLGLGRIDDEAQLQPLVDDAIAALPKAVATFREGKEKALDALKGHVMKATRGRADHEVVDRLLRAAIAASPD